MTIHCLDCTGTNHRFKQGSQSAFVEECFRAFFHRNSGYLSEGIPRMAEDMQGNSYRVEKGFAPDPKNLLANTIVGSISFFVVR